MYSSTETNLSDEITLDTTIDESYSVTTVEPLTTSIESTADETSLAESTVVASVLYSSNETYLSHI